MQNYLLSALFVQDQHHDKKHPREKHMTQEDKIEYLKTRTSFKLPYVLCTCLRRWKEKKMVKEGLNRIQKELEID